MKDFDDPTSNSKYYKWGFFYCNNADPRVFVPKRYGFGYSLNFGKPYVTVGFILLILIIFYSALFY